MKKIIMIMVALWLLYIGSIVHSFVSESQVEKTIQYGDDYLYKRLSIRGYEGGERLTDKRIKEIIQMNRGGPNVHLDSVYVEPCEWLWLEKKLAAGIIFKGAEKYGERIF